MVKLAGFWFGVLVLNAGSGGGFGFWGWWFIDGLLIFGFLGLGGMVLSLRVVFGVVFDAGLVGWWVWWFSRLYFVRWCIMVFGVVCSGTWCVGFDWLDLPVVCAFLWGWCNTVPGVLVWFWVRLLGLPWWSGGLWALGG